VCGAFFSCRSVRCRENGPFISLVLQVMQSNARSTWLGLQRVNRKVRELILKEGACQPLAESNRIDKFHISPHARPRRGKSGYPHPSPSHRLQALTGMQLPKFTRQPIGIALFSLALLSHPTVVGLSLTNSLVWKSRRPAPMPDVTSWQ
jgi:hypothetical protein